MAIAKTKTKSKPMYLVGMLMHKAAACNGMNVQLSDKKQGILGVLPVFKTLKQATSFAKGTDFPVIAVSCDRLPK